MTYLHIIFRHSFPPLCLHVKYQIQPNAFAANKSWSSPGIILQRVVQTLRNKILRRIFLASSSAEASLFNTFHLNSQTLFTDWITELSLLLSRCWGNLRLNYFEMKLQSFESEILRVNCADILRVRYRCFSILLPLRVTFRINQFPRTSVCLLAAPARIQGNVSRILWMEERFCHVQ